MTIYFVSDALASRMLQTADINNSLGMVNNTPRGAELEDAALLQLLDCNIKQILCSELKTIDPNSFYIISNFVTLSKESINQLVTHKNYIIFEHDHKYVPTRNPFSFSVDGKVPKKNLINVEFYQAARKVICITEWHETQVKINTDANTTNIHGGIWTYDELNYLEELTELNKTEIYAIIWSRFKNPEEARNYAIQHKLRHRAINSISDRKIFLKTLAKHKGLIFFPIIPETGSRIIMESKMLGLDVITNKNSGAANEYWFDKNGKELINLFKNELIPNIKTIFEEQL